MNETQLSEAFDATLFDRFSEIAIFEDYLFLEGDKTYRNDQKNLFEAGEIENPALDYPKLDSKALSNHEDKLLSFKKDLLEGDHQEVVTQTYRWRINEKIAQIRMLQETQVLVQPEASKEDKTRAMRRFKRYNQFIYGNPSRDIFAYTINNLKPKVEQSLDSENLLLRTAASDLLDSLPDLDRPKVDQLPDQTTIDFARKTTLEQGGDLIEIPESEDNFTPDQLVTIFQSALQSLNAEGWKAEIMEGRSSFGVNQENKTLIIPETSRSRTKVMKLLAHEVNTHVARRLAGERSKLRLLGVGLDRYIRGEEGIAGLREQALENEVDDFTGFTGHFAIGLAQGLDGTPRDFRAVYEILQKYYYYNKLSKGIDEEKAQLESKRLAWNRGVRTFRGTDSSTPGTCYTKDIVYREGNMGVWNVIRNNPDEMIRFSIGKYDPANKRHIWILNQLGITDTDLKNLEQT